VRFGDWEVKERQLILGKGGRGCDVMSVEMLEGLVIILMKTNYQVKYELGVIYKEKLTNKV
jgi:hypothetical protein